MINVSDKYKTAVKADTELSTFAGRFALIPVGAETGAEVTAEDARPQSSLSEVKTDGVLPKYATLEPGRWKLDGTYELVDPASGVKTGFMSAAMSGADGAFSSSPRVMYTMDREYDLIGLTLFFDELEYATAVTVTYFDAEGETLASETFENEQGLTVWAVRLACTGVKSVAVDIDAWSEPYRFAKLGGILPGEEFVFDADNAFSLEYTESISPFAGELNTPEMTITVDDSERLFDVINPQGFMAYLRQMMRLSAKVGIFTDVWEYVPLGDMYLWEWPTDRQTDTAQFTCRPLVSFKLNENVPWQRTETGLTTVAEAAAHIMNSSGISAYEVDETLSSLTVNAWPHYAFNLQTAMQHLATAVRGFWRFGRDGVYRLLPLEMSADAIDIVDNDALYGAPEVEQTQKITRVNVIYWLYDARSGDWDELAVTVRADVDDGAQGEDITSYFIPTEADAITVGKAALAFWAKRLKYSVQWRGDPALEAGDTVWVQHDYGYGSVLVTSQTVEWNTKDKLIGSLEGVCDA